MNENLPEGISFGEWLHRRRRLLDLTQQQLADQVGCAHITLRRIESGTLKPSRAMALILLEKLGVPRAERESWLPFTRGFSGFPEQPMHPDEIKPANNLPNSLTSFIGREKELQEITNFLARFHLVTLLGSGGIGKSRLALQVARKILDQYPDGVWLVDLAPILDPLLVPRTTANMIGLRDEPERPLIDMLCDYLRLKKMLLLLDNCEHLVDNCAHMSAKILQAASHVRILATSREAFEIAGEVTYSVPSLAVHSVEHLPAVASLSNYEAVQLFIERAAAAVPAFHVTDDHAPLLAQICQRLDGIPLAIELAAAKTRVLSIEQIAERLDDRFRLLTSGSRTELEHHLTLRAALDWSYNFLSLAEQTLFRRLSVFVGGWTLEAAESVGSDEPHTGILGNDVFYLLEQLINKSLVIMEEVQHESRYHMLETIRQYADEKLADSGERDALRDRHLDYSLSLAETAAPHLIRPEQVEWLNRLEGEHGNLRAALEWSLGKERPEQALRLVASLGTFWEKHSHWKEGARWLESALAMPISDPTSAEKAARARALYQDTALAGAMDNIERERVSAEESLALCEQGTDRLDLAIARFRMGSVFWRAGDIDKRNRFWNLSLADFHELNDLYWEANVTSWFIDDELAMGKQSYPEIIARNLEMARRAGERQLLSIALLDAANFAWVNNDLQHAQIYLEEADRIRAELGLTAGYLFPDLHACIAHSRKDYQRARELYMQAIQKLEFVGEKNVRAWTIQYLGVLERDDENLQEAQALFETALDIKRKIGMPGEVCTCLALLGQVLQMQGDRAVARQHFKEGLLIAKAKLVSRNSRLTLGSIRATLILVSGFFIEQAAESATRILAVVHAYHANKANPPMGPHAKHDFENILSQVRLQLEEAVFEAAWAEGTKLSLNEAFDLALETLGKT